MPMVGGLGTLKEVDDNVRAVLTQVLEEIKTKIEGEGKLGGKRPESLQPLGYKTQVVAGTNYFIKLLCDEEHVIHARLFRNLQGQVTLHSVTEQKTLEEDVEYF